jgi:hypothetical protein
MKECTMATITLNQSNMIVIAGNVLNQPRRTRELIQGTSFGPALFNGISLSHRARVVTPSRFSLIETFVERDEAGNSILHYVVRNDNPPGNAPGVPGLEVEFFRDGVLIGA